MAAVAALLPHPRRPVDERRYERESLSTPEAVAWGRGADAALRSETPLDAPRMERLVDTAPAIDAHTARDLIDAASTVPVAAA